MKISVVICTRDRHETIGQAVESVLGCDYSEFDIHVMDQSTNDLTHGIVCAIADAWQAKRAVHYHHLEKAGLSRAYNSGMQASDGEIIAFTDDDCILPADWLSQIATDFQTDPQIGLVYGQVLVPESLHADHMSGKLIVPNLPIPEREKLDLQNGFKVFGMGANMAMRRSLLEKVKGFDEALGGGGPLRSAQDYDFAYRTYRFGSSIQLDPQVKADHYGVRTPEQWPVTMRNYGIGDGAFYCKHMRCGDLLAIWLFAKILFRSWAREIRSLVRDGKWKKDEYGRYLLVGLRDASKFAIDRKYRLYQETERARMTETQANVVTATADSGQRSETGGRRANEGCGPASEVHDPKSELENAA
jgi:glycosyltransferase involved in cell wall biosynthesis